MTNKELMALPIYERRKIMEEQSTDLIEYYQTTNLWEQSEEMERMSLPKHRKNNSLIVYGVGCVWWDSIDKAGHHVMPDGHRLPCCPRCGSVLYQVSENEWWKGVNEYEKTNPGYSELIKWLRGKCFKTMSEAKAQRALGLI